MRHHHLHLDILGVPITIRTTEEQWIEFLGLLFEPLLSNREVGTSPSIEILRNGNGWDFTPLKGDPFHLADPWLVAVSVKNNIIPAVLRERPEIFGLHTALLMSDDCCLALVGPWGTGKSTLTLEFLLRGWAYGTDDLAVIDAQSGALIAIPKPMTLKSGVVWRKASGMWKPPSWLPIPSRVYLVPPSAVEMIPQMPVHPKAIVSPKYSRASAPELRSMSRGRSISVCAENAFRNVDQSGLRTIATLCQETRGAELKYGSSGEAHDLLVDWLL